VRLHCYYRFQQKLKAQQLSGDTEILQNKQTYYRETGFIVPRFKMFVFIYKTFIHIKLDILTEIDRTILNYKM